MSAFMVEDRTINDPVAFLKDFTRDDNWILKPLAKLGYDLAKREDRERLAKDLFVLNIDGVNARYGENQAQEFRPLDFTFVDGVSSPKRLNIVQCVKSLRCLIYQCSEGDVPQRDLYKAMEQVLCKLEAHVVRNLPAYDKAEWA